MTRAEKKAEERARMARVAIRVFAQMAAKNAVKQQIRAQGLKLWDFTVKDIAVRAEAWLEAGTSYCCLRSWLIRAMTNHQISP